MARIHVDILSKGPSGIFVTDAIGNAGWIRPHLRGDDERISDGTAKNLKSTIHGKDAFAFGAASAEKLASRAARRPELTLIQPPKGRRLLTTAEFYAKVLEGHLREWEQPNGLRLYARKVPKEMCLFAEFQDAQIHMDAKIKFSLKKGRRSRDWFIRRAHTHEGIRRRFTLRYFAARAAVVTRRAVEGARGFNLADVAAVVEASKIFDGYERLWQMKCEAALLGEAD